MVKLLSVHIPKAAGTTFREVLSGVYGVGRVFEDYGGTPVAELQIADTIRVIHGHFLADKYSERFPTARRIVWLRHPLFRLISEYFYAQTLQDRTNPAHAQLLDQHLSLLDFAALPAMQNTISIWLNNVSLEGFDFVGIQEFYPQDLYDLQQHLGWPDLPVEARNTNRYPAYSQHIQDILADTQLVNQLAQFNRTDLQLYHHALNLRAQRRHESVFIQPLLADWHRSHTLLHHGHQPLSERGPQSEPSPAPSAAASASEEGEVFPVTEGHYPLPPESLRWRVINNTDLRAYLESGQRIAKYFDQRLRSSGGDLSACTHILDFGCGAGRILRGLPPFTQANLTGCDIDPEAIAWAKHYLPFGQFYETQEYPPLPFEDETFDFVYAVAVFDHLDEQHQFCWLDELRRVTKPDGFVFATVKGPSHVEKLGGEEKAAIEAQLKRHGFYYEVTNFWAEVFPDYYQQAFHTLEYIQENWSKYFSIIDIDPPGVISQYNVWMRNSLKDSSSL